MIPPDARRKSPTTACAAAILVVLASSLISTAADAPAVTRFRAEVQPILERFCYDCHGDGMAKGNVAFDAADSNLAVLENRDLWWKVLKNLRGGIMPPSRKPQPGADDKLRVESWIKSDVFKIDPRNPDPGRVTVRRLNRVEYRNTIRDLMGIQFNAEATFPPDDAGYGFDNNGDVLTLPPMLLEKYLAAARTIVTEAVPAVPTAPAENAIAGRAFRRSDGSAEGENAKGWFSLSYYKPAAVSSSYRAEHAGRYQLILNLTANEKYVDGIFDYNRCRLVFKVDGQELLQKEFSREGGKAFRYELDREWEPGEHALALAVEPLTPDEKQIRTLELRVQSVTVRGPLDERYWVPPRGYDRFFPKGMAPADPEKRRAYARELLGGFATRAFRRPVDERTVDRLAALAESVYGTPRRTFEAGVAQAMVAVLASPRFLFREEEAEPLEPGDVHPRIDEYALASRLSYFLWSTMPDEELFRLAGSGTLGKNLDAQVQRMLADSRSEALTQNFAGQWLQARDIENVAIDSRAVLAREEKVDPEMDRLRKRFRELRSKPEESLTPEEKEEFAKVRAEFFKSFGRVRVELNGELRQAMRQETEKFFDYIVRRDRSILELIDSEYTFLNEKLAKHYGVNDVTGNEMRLVELPPDSPRGGVLTQGTVLAVTSNPTRTSPVKRGLFILDNILGMPPPPPPPDIPPLEDSAKGVQGHEPTLRETLQVHRGKPLCGSCHNRMDPLGLALENFNAMGMWREKERDQALDVAGTLITGESFGDIRELKRILATERRRDFFRCLTEKLLIYALGRGLDFYDVQTVDDVIARIEKENGRFSALLHGIIESSPFQRRRGVDTVNASELTREF
jgi:hypothetical protein